MWTRKAGSTLAIWPRMDEDGYIRITGRTKDIIIRGGENIPVVEVENLLYQHPAVKDVAVVAMPDDRLGERACGFVTLQPGTAPHPRRHDRPFSRRSGWRANICPNTWR